MHSSRSVILDMDNACGMPMRDVDDGLALALALTSPQVRLLGCTACSGNCRSGESAANTLHMLQLAERTDIPVGLGPEAPLQRDRKAHFDHVESASDTRREYWPASSVTPDNTAKVLPPLPDAPTLMAELACESTEAVTPVCTGSLTNMALALQRFPHIRRHIREIIHMGGAYEDPPRPDWEGSTPDIPAEIWRTTLRFNPLYDPEASAEVFASGIPTTVIPANVTMQVFLTLSVMDYLTGSTHPMGRFLHDSCVPWIRWSMDVRKLPGAHMHDPLALATAFLPGLCRYETMHVDMRRLLTPEGCFLHREGKGPQVRVAVGVDTPAFSHIMTKALTAYR